MNHKEAVRKLVAFFGDLTELLQRMGMEIGVGNRRSSEELGTVQITLIVKPTKTESGVTGTYEIARKPVHGTGDMFELFNFTIVPGFGSYGTDLATPELQKEFERWIGKCIEWRIAEKARQFFGTLVETPRSDGKALVLPDLHATAEAIKLSLNQYEKEWGDSTFLREEFFAEFLEAKKARQHAEETEATCKARAKKILEKF